MADLKTLKGLGSLLSMGLAQDNTDDQSASHVMGPTATDITASADVTFPFTIFFAMRLWNDCNRFICVVRAG